MFLTKDLKHNRLQRGEENFDNGDDDDDHDDHDDDDDNDYNVFSSSQGTSNRVGTRGGR